MLNVPPFQAHAVAQLVGRPAARADLRLMRRALGSGRRVAMVAGAGIGLAQVSDEVETRVTCLAAVHVVDGATDVVHGNAIGAFAYVASAFIIHLFVEEAARGAGFFAVPLAILTHLWLASLASTHPWHADLSPSCMDFPVLVLVAFDVCEFQLVALLATPAHQQAVAQARAADRRCAERTEALVLIAEVILREMPLVALHAKFSAVGGALGVIRRDAACALAHILGASAVLEVVAVIATDTYMRFVRGAASLRGGRAVLAQTVVLLALGARLVYVVAGVAHHALLAALRIALRSGWPDAVGADAVRQGADGAIEEVAVVAGGARLVVVPRALQGGGGRAVVAVAHDRGTRDLLLVNCRLVALIAHRETEARVTRLARVRAVRIARGATDSRAVGAEALVREARSVLQVLTVWASVADLGAILDA